MRIRDRTRGGRTVRMRAAMAAAAAASAAALIAPVAAESKPVTLTLNPHRIERQIPDAFLGVAIEYQTLPRYSGMDPNAVDPVLIQLIRNLTPAQAPVLRFGGDTTDWSWWPVPGMRPPPGVSYNITPQWTAVASKIQQSLGAHLIMGINFEADSNQIAQTEANQLISHLGSNAIAALELGNEPELYHSFGWYQDAAGNEVPGRPANWGFPTFQQEFNSISSRFPAAPVAGPTTGNPTWDANFGKFLADDRRVKIAAVHRYPLWVCRSRTNPLYPTIKHLLSRHATAGLAASAAALVRIAHARHLPLRIDEMNMTPCPYQATRLQPSVATALWSADIPFEMAAVGVDGVNVQTSTGGTQDVFDFKYTRGGWRAKVMPQYYGLMMFARAAPKGARLLAISGAPIPLRAWATRAPDGTYRVLVINNGSASQSVSIGGVGSAPPATVERLRGGRSVTLGGQTFGASTSTGRFAAREATTPVLPSSGHYVFGVPGRSAALLTIP